MEVGKLAARPKHRWLRAARVRPLVLLWALGISLPIILIIYLLRGCQ